jgi:hypothetical protein
MKGQGEKKQQNSKRKRQLPIVEIVTQNIKVFAENEQVDLLPPPMASIGKSQAGL